MGLFNFDITVFDCNYVIVYISRYTVRTARFSQKSPWSVFFHGEMSVICHKITIKCRWNNGETFTVKIYKLGPKCRWNILIVGENHTYIHVHVTALHVFFCFLTISYFIFQFDTGVIWYFEPHGKLNPGSIYLWHFDPRFNFPYGILTPVSIFCHCILNPPHFYQKRGVHNTIREGLIYHR